MAIKLTDFVSYFQKKVPAKYFAYSFPAEFSGDSIAVSYFYTQPDRIGLGKHKITLQFQAKYKNAGTADSILGEIIDLSSNLEHTSISRDIRVIGARPLTSAPVILGHTDSYNAILLVNIEFDISVLSQIKL